MSPFKRMFALAGRVIDVPFGETFRVVPRMREGGNVNGRLVRDPGRDPFEFTGSFVAVDEEAHAEGRRMPEKTTRASVAPKPMIDFATAGRPYLPREGDLVRRLETGDWFEVSKEIGDDVGRSTLHLLERQGALAV